MNLSLADSGGSSVSALTAAKFGIIQNMRLVCLPSELPVFSMAGAGASAAVVIANSGFAWVAESGWAAESPVLPDCWVCCSGAGTLRLSGSADWGQTSVGDIRRNRTTAALLIVCIYVLQLNPM